MGELITVAEKKENMKSLLLKYQGEFEKILPKSIGAERFIRVSLNAMNAIPKLYDCTQSSFALCLLESAALGLEPFVAGQCYVLPYEMRKQSKTVAQLIIGYRGYIQLARRSGEVDAWVAEVVRANDFFKHTLFPPEATHELNHESPERGELVAAYSGVKLRGGIWQPYVMYKPEIEKRQKSSASARSEHSSWKLWTEEMWKKTPVRGHQKYLPFAIEQQEMARALELDDRADIGTNQFKDSQYQEIFTDELKTEIEETETGDAK